MFRFYNFVKYDHLILGGNLKLHFNVELDIEENEFDDKKIRLKRKRLDVVHYCKNKLYS